LSGVPFAGQVWAMAGDAKAATRAATRVTRFICMEFVVDKVIG